MFQADRTEELLDRATQLVEEARKAGADRCNAVVARGRSTSVSVRLGNVEGTEASESDSFSLRVFVGKRVASVSANAGTEAAQLAERVVSMARVSPDDPQIVRGLASRPFDGEGVRGAGLDMVSDGVLQCSARASPKPAPGSRLFSIRALPAVSSATSPAPSTAPR